MSALDMIQSRNLTLLCLWTYFMRHSEQFHLDKRVQSFTVHR